MKGVIILPKYLENFWAKRFSDGRPDFNNILSGTAPFFYIMRDNFGFELKYADEVDVDIDTDIVFMWGVPYHNRPKLIPGLVKLDKKIKLILWPGDLQCYGNKNCLKNKIKVFERCDLILSPSYQYFTELYPQFLYKYKFMPRFFFPHDRYINLPYNDNPNMKCLLSGSLNPKVYPLRTFVKNNSGGMVVYKPAKYVGDDYARLLHSYFCGIATPSIFNYALGKYYEIPAAGSLLLASEVFDFGKAGFIPNQHYVPITKSNVISTITQCIKNPDEYEHIRKRGMEFVRKNHSVANRMDSLKAIFRRLKNE